jgi:DNA-binding transcriptional LysR family regulator
MQDTREMPVVRALTNRFTSWVTSKLARQHIPDSQCGYRLIMRAVLPDLKLSTARFETETEMLIQAGRAGHKIATLPIRTIYEPGRVSRIRPWRDTVRFFKMAWKYW